MPPTTTNVIPGLVPGTHGAAYSVRYRRSTSVISYFTYILASRPRGTLYVSVTNNIIRRVEEHRAGKGSAFTRRYNVHLLVWYEECGRIADAIQREKSIKDWPRAWKVNLIERENLHWQDRYLDIPGVRPAKLL